MTNDNSITPVDAIEELGDSRCSAMYFQTAPVNELCPCVTTTTTDAECRLIDRAPYERQKGMIDGLLKRNEGNRWVNADCPLCDANGIHPNFY